MSLAPPCVALFPGSTAALRYAPDYNPFCGHRQACLHRRPDLSILHRQFVPDGPSALHTPPISQHSYLHSHIRPLDAFLQNRDRAPPTHPVHGKICRQQRRHFCTPTKFGCSGLYRPQINRAKRIPIIANSVRGKRNPPDCCSAFPPRQRPAIHPAARTRPSES